MIFQKYSKLILAKILLLGILIPNIIATDCDIFSNAIAALGGSLQLEYSSITDCCLFRGVTCDSYNHIFEIKISNFVNLTGDLNKAIEEFSNLEFLSSLKLDKIKTEKSVGIPKSIGKLEKLKILSITNSENDFADTSIPEEIGNLVNLEELNLSSNNLNGNIPTSFTKLKKIQSINLAYNKLEGVVPYEFQNLEYLIELKLNRNDLKGYVPPIQNLNTCTYYSTKLCYLKSATCRSNAGCTADEIKDTNKYNGSPSLTKYVGEAYSKTKSSTKSSSSSGSGYFLICLAVIFVSIYFCCKCCCCDSSDKKLNKIQHQSLPSYNEYANSTTSSTTTTNNNNENTTSNVAPYAPAPATTTTTTTTPGNISVGSVNLYTSNNEAYNTPVMPPPVIQPILPTPMSLAVPPVMPYNPVPVNGEMPPPMYTPAPYNTSYVNYGPVPVPGATRDATDIATTDPNVSMTPGVTISPAVPTAPVDTNIKPMQMPLPAMPMPSVSTSPIPMAPVDEKIPEKQ